MLKFSPITITPFGDFTYTTELKLLETQGEGRYEKTFTLTAPHPHFLERMASSEWSWYMRGNITTYVQRCIAVWDNHTQGGAPIMAKQGMDKCAVLLVRFTDYLNSEKCYYLKNVCEYFDKMLPHLRYALPPNQPLLSETLQHLTDACEIIKAAIAGDGNILKVETEKASA